MKKYAGANPTPFVSRLLGKFNTVDYEKDNINIHAAALLIGGLAGCYEDKGNYKYRDINEVTYKILPESEDGYYRFKQPPMDTMYVDYTVDLSQSQAANEENLEFLWLVSYSKDKKQ